jgi:4'-phosphopantetheinyl transferase
MLSVLAPLEVHIWYRHTESATSVAVEAARATLSTDERARADRFHFDQDRRDYTLAHDLLRRCLSKYRPVAPTAWAFQTDAAGKPFLPSDSTLSFNLSHTRELVACAIASGMPVGIDAERTGRILDAAALAERYFSPCETASLARGGADALGLRFLELWTLKEAFAKAVGAGLTLPLNSMSFGLDQEDMITFEPPASFVASEWHFALFELAACARIAVAVQAASPPRFVTFGFAPDTPAADVRELRPSRVSTSM